MPGLLAFCRTAGFPRVITQGLLAQSACIACYRTWEAPAHDAATGPGLLKVERNLNHGINFDSKRDENLPAWFRYPGASSVNDVQLEAVSRARGEVWQTNFKLPPGLTPGWHTVRIRVRASRPGSAQRMAVDVPAIAAPRSIEGVAKDNLDLARGRIFSLGRNNVRVEMKVSLHDDPCVQTGIEIVAE